MPSRDFLELAAAVRRRCGDGVQAVLLYGSCLRSGQAAAGVVDLYVIVSRYPGRLAGWLPPAVYYLEVTGADGRTVRCKYALISLDDFAAGVERWFHSYLWARFAQPATLLYVRDETVRERVSRLLDRAVLTFLAETIPTAAAGATDAAALWQHGLELSYGSELRPEPAQQARQLAAENRGHYARALAVAAPALADRLRPLPGGGWEVCADARLRRRHARRWLLRRWQGKLLSVLRWLKGAVTFSGGVDYAAWKIERHTGVRIEVTDTLRRHPFIYGWPVLWQLWRRGALK